MNARIALFVLIPSAFGLAATPTVADDKVEFKWKLEAGKVLHTTLEIDSTRSTEMEITIDGNDARFGGPQGHETTEHMIVKHKDRIVKTKDGRPTSVKRFYDEVERAMEFGDHGGDPMTSDVVGHWIGIDESGEEKKIELPDELELKDHQKKALRIYSDLGNFLPAKAVGVGAKWEVKADRVRELLTYANGLMSGGRAFHLQGGGGEEVEVDIDELKEKIKKAQPDNWETKCSLDDVEEEDGRKIATIKIKSRLERKPDEAGGVKADGGAIMITMGGGGEGEETLEGSLRFDLTSGHIVSLELEGEIELSSESEQDSEIGTIAMTSNTSGERSLSLSFELTKDEDG